MVFAVSDAEGRVVPEDEPLAVAAVLPEELRHRAVGLTRVVLRRGHVPRLAVQRMAGKRISDIVFTCCPRRRLRAVRVFYGENKLFKWYDAIDIMFVSVYRPVSIAQNDLDPSEIDKLSIAIVDFCRWRYDLNEHTHIGLSAEPHADFIPFNKTVYIVSHVLPPVFTTPALCMISRNGISHRAVPFMVQIFSPS